MTKEVFEDCPATGEGCSYEKQSIPSEFITGMAGGVPYEVTQCKYCGKAKEESDE